MNLPDPGAVIRRLEDPDDDPVTWYARAEVAGTWRIPACGEHGRSLASHRFSPAAPAPGRGPAPCAVCDRPELLREIERCTCEFDSARCPEHRNLGCGC